MADRKPNRAPTSIDVARAAGVSQSVVSRAFSDAPGVSAATRERVQQAAARLGYRHNQLARGLITQRSNLLALVAGGLTNPLHLDLIQALSRQAQSRGHRVLLVTAPDGHDVDGAIADVLPYMPAGIIAMAGTPGPAAQQACARRHLPLVIVGRDAEAAWASWVCCDNEAAAREVAQRLLAAGHRRFAFLASREADASFSLARERGFCTTVVAAGCAAPVVMSGGSSYAGGLAAAAAMLKARPRPQAVFCAGDFMALGLMDAVRQDAALAIPEDLSVVGFDDVPMAAWASYDLTTIRQRVDSMADAAIEIALASPNVGIASAESRLVPGDLIVRRSAKIVT